MGDCSAGRPKCWPTPGRRRGVGGEPDAALTGHGRRGRSPRYGGARRTPGGGGGAAQKRGGAAQRRGGAAQRRGGAAQKRGGAAQRYSYRTSPGRVAPDRGTQGSRVPQTGTGG